MIVFVTFIITLMLIVFQCTEGNIAGGTADTGNAKIAGTIYTYDGKFAAGIPVVFYPTDYLPEISNDQKHTETVHYKTFTNDSGFFTLDSIADGDYTIEVNDNVASALCFNIIVKDTAESTLSLIDTLKPYSTIQGNIGSVSDTSLKRFVLIYGLDRRIPVSSNGHFYINDLPAGNIKIRIVSDNKDWEPVEIDSISLLPAQATSIPFAGWSSHATITINTTATGAGVNENVYNFPLLIRLSEDNFNFSSAENDGSDCRFFKHEDIQLSSQIEQWDAKRKLASIWVYMDTVYGNCDTQTIYLLCGNKNNDLLEGLAPVFKEDDGFLGCYHLNGNLENATGKGYDGIDSGTMDNSSGVIGNARLFNGYSSFFSVRDLPERPSGTISFWFCPTVTVNQSSTTAQGIWGKYSNDSINSTLTIQGLDYYYVPIKTAGNLITKIEDADSGFYLPSTTNSFSAGIWYHVAWSWGENSNTLYVNGKLESSIPDYRPVSGDGNDEIGRSYYDISNIMNYEPRYFYGKLDEFRLENTNRNAAWIKLSYMNQRPDMNMFTIRFQHLSADSR